MNRIRSAWSAITASPGRMAAAGGVAVAALMVGVGFSLAVNSLRDDAEQAASAGPTVAALESASPVLVVSAPATPTATPAPTITTSPSPTASPTVTPATPTPVATDAPTPAPTPVPPTTARCDDITVDEQGLVYVNGEVVVEDPWAAQYGEQMPMAVLRLAARAGAARAADPCLEVDLPGPIVTGAVEICGDVVSPRLAPTETPPPPSPAPTLPPRYGEPTIDGVLISDRMLDVNSYPLLGIADAADVPACFHVQSHANDVYVTLSLAICPMVRWGADGDLTIVIGSEEWTFEPDYVYDDSDALIPGETVAAGLDIRSFLDDVRHYGELALWVTPGCP